jgi:hypothetical protein
LFFITKTYIVIMSDIEKHQDIQQERVTPAGDSEDGNNLKTIDTVHQDEAMRVLATYQGPEEWTEQEEKSLRRKIDLRLMPVLCITYGLQYYDKAMLSQAVRDHLPHTNDL